MTFGAFNGTALVVDGYAITVPQLIYGTAEAAGLGGGYIVLNNGSSLTYGSNGTNQTYSGLILGAGGSVTKVGTGTETLGMPDFYGYTGPTYINSGTVIASSAYSLPGNVRREHRHRRHAQCEPGGRHGAGLARRLRHPHQHDRRRLHGARSASTATTRPSAALFTATTAADLSITKIGTGTLTLTGSSASTGILNVYGGGLTIAGTRGSLHSPVPSPCTPPAPCNGRTTRPGSARSCASPTGTGVTVEGGNFVFNGKASLPATQSIRALAAAFGQGSLMGQPGGNEPVDDPDVDQHSRPGGRRDDLNYRARSSARPPAGGVADISGGRLGPGGQRGHRQRQQRRRTWRCGPTCGATTRPAPIRDLHHPRYHQRLSPPVGGREMASFTSGMGNNVANASNTNVLSIRARRWRPTVTSTA